MAGLQETVVEIIESGVVILLATAAVALVAKGMQAFLSLL